MNANLKRRNNGVGRKQTSRRGDDTGFRWKECSAKKRKTRLDLGKAGSVNATRALSNGCGLGAAFDALPMDNKQLMKV